MIYLLDTNFCIAYLRGRLRPVLERFRSHHPDELSVCATVRSELVYGALRGREAQASLAIVHQFLAPLFCYPFDEAIADVTASIRADLSATGSLIGPFDLANRCDRGGAGPYPRYPQRRRVFASTSFADSRLGVLRQEEVSPKSFLHPQDLVLPGKTVN